MTAVTSGYAEALTFSRYGDIFNKSLSEKKESSWVVKQCKHAILGAIEYIKYFTIPSVVLGSACDKILNINFQTTECLGYNKFLELMGGDKTSLFSFLCLSVPIREEVLFREVLQRRLLYQLPKFCAKKLSPGSEEYFETDQAKKIRIVVSSAFFSSVHLINMFFAPKSFVALQTVGAFAIGIVLGHIRESKYGLIGAIGAHMLNNACFTVHSSWVCEP